MLKFAFKNMAIKKVQIILIIVSIVISAGVGVLSFNVSEQVSEGLTNNAGYYSAIIGPSGSATQLAMNTMYFTDEPVGTIPYSLVSELAQDNRVTEAIPFAMADNYNGFSVVGTTPAFLSAKTVAQGNMFDQTKTFQAVVGSKVAELNDLKIGDKLYTSHSASGDDKHATPLTVVGILEESHSGFDKIVFTQLKTIWQAHDHGDEGEHDEAAVGVDMLSADTNEQNGNVHETPDHGGHENNGHEDEGEHEGEAHGQTVCAILIKTVNPTYAMSIVNEYDGRVYMHGDESYSLQAIEPMDTMRGVLEETDNTKYIVFVLCAIILIMNIIIISIITLLNMYHSAKEISLMRLIGISMKKINMLYLIQNSIIGLISTALAFGVSRACLLLMSDYVESMGAVLNMAKVYPLEILILVAVFLISVIPTVICTMVMSKKDGINN
ncbi:MAG: ABC transporter permease [Ruminococcaceae bacterium]|nr:ABC transporter permease [Oscillospiraceae bacterium]